MCEDDIVNMLRGVRIWHARMAACVTWLPRGHTLPEANWRRRHRAVTALLVAHAIVFAVYVTMRGIDPLDSIGDVAVPALGAFAASRTSLSRQVRSCIAAASLMLTSAVVVHLMSGSLEGHFHFFVMIPVVALYEDWVPFGIAVALVLAHHGVMGTIAPRAVYDQRVAWLHPWRFALVHSAFFAAACAGAIVNWRLQELSRSAEHELAQSMRYQSQHDPLTDLPNRSWLVEHAEHLLTARCATDGSVAMLIVDLDGFKQINDVLGHGAGDELLIRVGSLIKSATRDGDLLARLGGDEFALVLAGADESIGVTVAERLRALVSGTIRLDGVPLNIEASVGIATSCSAGPEDVENLMRQADIAMYRAKQERSGYSVYRVDQRVASRAHLALLGELRLALENDEIFVEYQPKVALPGGEVIGAEALARWQHPTRGLLPPSEFIPVAEDAGVILPFTLHVLDLAMAQLKTWQASTPDFTMAVNLSPRCLTDPHITAKILQTLLRHDVRPALLTLEITENTLAYDPDRALATLTQLHEAGVHISIDDFGTGYSSMSYLKRLPTSELKVDRSFVSDMVDDAEDAILVHSVIELGHSLGLTVVAEGVEDQATLDALTQAGCDVVQGFFIGRPMIASVFDMWWSAKNAPSLEPWRAAGSRR